MGLATEPSADLNRQRGAHAVPETTRGGRSHSGVKEPSQHMALCLVAYLIVERERLDQGCTWRQLKQRLIFEGRQFSLPALERVLSAGAPSDPAALAALGAASAPSGESCTPYGATEALPGSHLSSRKILTDTRAKTRRGAGVCVGHPIRGITVRIIPLSDPSSEDWSEVAPWPPGGIGEIAVAGGVVSARYCNNSEGTRRAKMPCRATGTLYPRRGDVGYLDDRGRL